MAKIKSFLIYLDRRKEVERLSDEQAGILLKAIMRYADSGEELDCEDVAVSILFSVMQTQIDASIERYEAVCKSRSAGQKKRYEQLKQDVQEAQKVQKAQKAINTNININTNTNTVSLSNETELFPTDRPTSNTTGSGSKGMDFNILLYNMGSYLFSQDEPFHSEDELLHYDIDEREVYKCIIPEKFMKNVQNMENALRFLIGFSNLEDKDFKNFCDSVISVLAEAVCSGQITKNQKADSYQILSRLNEINSDDMYPLGQWMGDFRRHYQKKLNEKLASGEQIFNRHAFLKTCAVNYLIESKAMNFCPGFHS